MKPRTHHFSMQYIVKICIVFIVWIGCFSSFSFVEAAVIDRELPTAPTQLQVKEKTDTTVSLTWNQSSDNAGIKGYDVYQNNIFIAHTSATQYTAKNLSPNTSYTFFIKVRDTSGNVSNSSTMLKVTTLSEVIDQPPNVSPVEGKYKKVGYYSGWSTYSNYDVSQIDASKLTHINYAFANISADGRIAIGDSWADVEKPFPGDIAGQPFKGNFYQLKKLKGQNPHLKTLISVGGWTWSEKFSDVALTEQSRTIFAQSCLQFILKYGFDGVDLDWEYPVGGGEADNVKRPEDKHNFTLLLKEIRETFDAQGARDGNQYLLTIAGGAGTSYVNNTELNLIQQYVDYIQLMSYDIHGPWDTFTGMNAPLYRDPNSGFNGDWSVEDAVQIYLNKGVPAHKLVMGVPFYGRVYSGVPNLNNGLYQSFSRGDTAIGYSVLAANYINKNGYTRYWQPYSKVPWLYNGSQFISYDDVESMGYKTTFIKSKGLGGAMIWELSQDPNRVLLTKIDNDLK